MTIRATALELEWAIAETRDPPFTPGVDNFDALWVAEVKFSHINQLGHTRDGVVFYTPHPFAASPVLAAAWQHIADNLERSCSCVPR